MSKNDTIIMGTMPVSSFKTKILSEETPYSGDFLTPVKNYATFFSSGLTYFK